MRKISVSLALLVVLSTAFLSCRETEKKADDIEDVADDVEDTADDDASDPVENTLQESVNEAQENTGLGGEDDA
ncbi:hypothetical protein [Altibacter lentus]|uniref:hypothetical protein n=1 Tax=Altibacter lentus TaxID=1223410 RepID=UPI00054EA969|nr:hypothetical protein [Altibacter lentus]